jgi:Holliday junction resolvase RusA-like endonuclease
MEETMELSCYAFVETVLNAFARVWGTGRKTIRIEVPGQPVPQPRARVSTRGGFARAYTPKDHAIHAYRQAVSLVARGRRIEGPVSLVVETVFERPPSHWRKHDLKPDAPLWPRADGDNLLKGIADAITDAGLWADDDQVVVWSIRKRYASRSEQARTIIAITEAEP